MLNISTGYGKELLNLAKIFSNNAKYNGHNNSFTFQLAIFHNICLRADVLPKAKIKAFLTMFKSLALNYYYSNISISTIAMNFNQVCNFIKNYFKEAKYKQSIFLKWNGLILKSVISKSKSKPIKKCLKELID